MELMKKGTAVAILSQQDQRCKCNKLLCVINGDDIEIKCNKCKRIMTIKTAGIVKIQID